MLHCAAALQAAAAGCNARMWWGTQLVQLAPWFCKASFVPTWRTVQRATEVQLLLADVERGSAMHMGGDSNGAVDTANAISQCREAAAAILTPYFNKLQASPATSRTLYALQNVRAAH